MKTKTILALILCLVLLVGSLAGCGSKETTSEAKPPESAATTGGDANTADSTSDQEASEEVSTSGDSAVYGGVLKYGVPSYPKTVGYTPLITANDHFTYLNIAYESLTFYDESGNIVPRLATDWKTDSDEPSVTWTLRQGVQFADGTPFNAEAVKVNIEEYQKNNRTEVSMIDSMEIIDDYTIKMNLSSWNSSTVESVGFYVYYMSPAVLASNPDSLNERTCGTGAFTLEDFETGVFYKYVKNENYWREGQPYLDGVEIRPVESTQTLATAFQNNEFDVAYINSYAVEAQLIEANPGNWNIEKNTTGVGIVMTGLIPNSAEDNSPFKDYRVRQALCFAIDGSVISEVCNYNMSPTTNQWAVPGSKTYDESLTTFSYNPEKAKELLAEAGYPDGFETTVTCIEANQEVFTACAGMLEEVGIHCNINLVDSAQQTQLYSDGTWHGLMGHFASCGPDLGLYMGRHLAYDGAYYAKGIEHPAEAMELLEKIQTAPTEEEKISYEHEMQKYMYDAETGSALFGMPLYVQIHRIFSHNNVHNVNGYIVPPLVCFWQIQMDNK